MGTVSGSDISNDIMEKFSDDDVAVFHDDEDISSETSYNNNVKASDEDSTKKVLDAREKTYIVVAVERKDGKTMSYDEDDILVSPFVQGVPVNDFNIYNMGANARGECIDGILYRMIECDTLEIFADREIYIGVTEHDRIGVAFYYDEKTGKIQCNEKYHGLGILFRVKLDSSKADTEKAKEYLKQLEDDNVYMYTIPTDYENLEYNDLGSVKATNEAIKKSQLEKGSEEKLVPDENGLLNYSDFSTSSKIVKEKGIDAATIYNDGNANDEMIVFTYENGAYYGRTYEYPGKFQKNK